MLIDLVTVTAPKPPGSSTLISPPAAVFEMAPAKVLHGAVRLHGLTSSPTPETQVRVAWANARELPRAQAMRARNAVFTILETGCVFMMSVVRAALISRNGKVSDFPDS